MFDAVVTNYLQQKLDGQAPSLQAVLAAHPDAAACLARRLQFVERVANRVLSERRDSTQASPGEAVEHSTVPPRAAHRPRLIKRRDSAELGRPGARAGSASRADDRTRGPHLIPGRRRNRLGRFELEAVLGQGGFGLVLRGFDPVLDRAVAIKVPRPGRQPKAEAARGLQHEARILAMLDHPGIVRVYEFGHDRGLPFLVTELVPGQSLAELLGTRELDVCESAVIVAQAAEALGSAHQRGVVHRDIKPGNLLIDASGRVRLTDFGLAHFADQCPAHEDPNLVGTPPFFSPETLGPPSRIDGRADVFALGVVLYRLLTGGFPFRGSPNFMLQQVLHLSPFRPSQLQPAVPPELDEICMRALDKRPRRRFQSAAEMAEALRRLA